jgi:formylglycine-generating enzyme required for sulfatase activity
MNAPRFAILSFLRSLILALGSVGAVASGFLGGVASGQSTPTGFSHIPGGSFTMGATSGDVYAWAPSITVTVSPFYIQQTETTKAQWDEVTTWAWDNGYSDLAEGEGKASNHPVQTVSWWDVVKWCNARSEKEGLTPVYTVFGAVMRKGTTEGGGPVANWSANGYRLPTEAEWEKAARGGVSGKRFPWGTDTISHAQANFRNNGGEVYATGTTGDHPSYTAGGEPYTSPVGSFGANSHGLYDMAGNVGEWCWDWWRDDTYQSMSKGTTDPRGPASGSSRVARGGHWLGNAFGAGCAVRLSSAPGSSDLNFFGFRPARSASIPNAPSSRPAAITPRPRPDAMVGRSLASLIGSEAYTGPEAQQLQLLSIPSRPVTAYAAVANRGNLRDRFSWRGSGDTRHFQVEYRDAAGALVSSAVRTGLYRTPKSEPGAPPHCLRVVVTPNRRPLFALLVGRSVTLRKVHTVLLETSSVADPSVRDAVSIRVETRQSGWPTGRSWWQKDPTSSSRSGESFGGRLNPLTEG